VALESYGLKDILIGIFGELEEAHALAQEHVTKAVSEMDIETEENGNAPPGREEAMVGMEVFNMPYPAKS
jgi:hypothetical protein